MELKSYLAVLLISSCVCTVLGNAIETAPDTKVDMGAQVTLPCKFTTSDPSDWMFIRWKKETEDGKGINIAIMQNTILSPDWSPSAPSDFKDHVELKKGNDGNGYSLDMIIEGFICTDVGTYTCEVFTLSNAQQLKSSTRLDIEVAPGNPAIDVNVLEVKVNDSFKIECEANVGLPPQTITWAYKLPGASHIYQKVMDGISQTNTAGPSCTTQGVSVLSLEMSEEYDMAVFLCATTSELADDGSPKNYDEVTLQLYGKTTTTTSTQAAPTTKKIVTDPTGAATIPSSVSAIIVCCLVTVYSLFTRTT